ncbi:MAG: type I-E CRISPR-associated protein Cse1/CasA [Chloroflexota bacterium]
MPAFSLVDEPWLPCLTKDGRPTDVSLRDAILNSHDLRELFDPSPLVTVALHRLLLALVRRIYGLHSDGDWLSVWSGGRFDPGPANRYFAEHAGDFDLFHATRPFMQVPPARDVKSHPVSWLMHEASSGNNPTLFDHSVDAAPRALTPAQTARYLLALHAAALGGGVSEPFNFCDAPLARDCAALVYGETLFSTLLLNSPPLPPAAAGEPVWEWDRVPAPERGGTPVSGELALLTWPARRISLMRDPLSGLVAACQIRQGLVAPADCVDPHKAYRPDQHGSLTPLRLALQRAVWRDVPVWLGAPSGTHPPRALRWLTSGSALDLAGGAIESPLRLVVFGLVTAPGRASIYLWRQDRCPLPLSCLRDSETVHEFAAAVARAEACGSALTAALSFLNRLLGVPAEAASSTVNDCLLTYWSELDSAASRLLLLGIPPRGDWNARLAGAARRAYDMALERVGRTAGRARLVAAARRFFEQRLATASAVPPDMVRAEGVNAHVG